MAGSRRRRQLHRQRARTAAAEKQSSTPPDDVRAIVDRLPPELLAEVHSRLPFLARLAFALAYAAAPGSRLMRPEPPWLLLSGDGDETIATAFSLADGAAAAAVRAPSPAMRGHVVLGSGGGWLVTADERGALRMANPASGEHADLPDLAADPLFLAAGSCFMLDAEAFAQLRFGGPPPPGETLWWPIPPRTYTMTAEQMRRSFYRKVVLAAMPESGGYAAMLILQPPFAVPAFATAEDPAWRLAPSRDGVADAIHHDGRFHSITYSGVVEAWDRDADTGEYTSTALSPRLPDDTDGGDGRRRHRTYLAAAPDGRLMAVIKYSGEVVDGVRRTVTRPFFKVRVLDRERAHGGAWVEAADDIVGDAAVFVGVNGSLCVPAREHDGGIRAGCVYFTDDDIGEAALRHEHEKERRAYLRERDDDEVRYLGVYSLAERRAERIPGLTTKRRCWPPAVWFTPSFS
ncbi:hypothetical protein ACP4OV_029053 [Aristida adscensionis]